MNTQARQREINCIFYIYQVITAFLNSMFLKVKGSGKAADYVVDLGAVHLVSGVQSQEIQI